MWIAPEQRAFGSGKASADKTVPIAEGIRYSVALR